MRRREQQKTFVDNNAGLHLLHTCSTLIVNLPIFQADIFLLRRSTDRRDISLTKWTNWQLKHSSGQYMAIEMFEWLILMAKTRLSTTPASIVNS